MPRRVLHLLYVPLAAALLLELVLQVGALVVWLGGRESAPAPARDGERVVLCVGDSFTYGVGTSGAGESYPEQLEQILRQRGTAARVVRCALPGRSSREVLEQIGAQLAEHRPALVYVLIGRNDQWSKPELLLQPAVDAGGFRLEWRTARFARWCLGHLDARRALPAAAAADAATAAALDRDPAATTASAAADPIAAITDPWEAMRRQRPDVALRLIAADLARNPGNHYSRATAVSAHLALGQRDAANAQLDWLRGAARDGADGDAVCALVSALDGIGAGDERLALAKANVERHPDRAQLWDAIAWESFQKGDLATAVPASAKALALVPQAHAAWKATLYKRQSCVVRARDPHAGLCSYVRGLLLGPLDAGEGWSIQDCSPEQLRAALDAVGVGGARRAAVEKFFARALGWERSAFEVVLERHLRQIVERCRAAAAEPVLLTYPPPFAWVEDATAAAARSTGAARIDVTAAFAARLAGRDAAQFFVADGHCNGAGYRLLAEIVAEDASRRAP